MTRIASLLTTFLSAMLIFPASATALDEPGYTVLSETPEYELRRYDAYLVAEVRVDGEFEDVGDRAFRTLFDYISGENEGERKVAMTAPVTQQKVPMEGAKIAMTAPVIQQPAGSEGEYLFAFVLPSEYTLETAPVPTDLSITIREVPSRLVAARRYSGSWSRKNYSKNERVLLAALDREGVETLAEPVYARFNSPFSLWFMRRNEVQVAVGS